MIEINYPRELTTNLPTFGNVTSTVMLAFILSIVIAFVYVWTLRKESYSRSYVQTIVLMAIIGSVIILSVGDNLARGIGVIAAVNIIRFRTNFKNPRDTVFLFASLTAGIACGSDAFLVAVEGTLCFSLAAVFLHYAPFSPATFYDGVISFKAANSAEHMAEVDRLLAQCCDKFALIAMEENSEKKLSKFTYNFKLKDYTSYEQLVQILKASGNASNIELITE